MMNRIVGRALLPIVEWTGRRARPTGASPRTKKRPVAGFSLIEMVVVFSMATGLAFASLRLLDAVSTLRDGTRNELQTFRDLHRLADQLRTDVHRADEGRTDDDDAVLVLTSNEGEERIHYEIVESTVRRIAESGPSAEDISRDGFRLPRRATVQWNVDDEASLVRLQVNSQRSGGVSFSIEAVLNRENQQ